MENEHTPATPQHSGDASHKNVGMAVVAYLIFFVPLLTDAKDDPFVKFHVKQGLLLFIMWVGAWFIAALPFLMPIAWLVQLAALVLVIIGIVNAVHGKEVPLPGIGHWAKHFTF